MSMKMRNLLSFPGRVAGRLRDCRLHRAIRRFGYSEDGTAVIEFAVLAPIMIFSALGLAQFWLGYQSSNRLQKATYTIADIASRWQAEAGMVANDARGLRRMSWFLMGNGDTPKLRITSVVWSQTRNRFEVQWSCSLTDGKYPALTTTSIQQKPNAATRSIAERIPMTADGDTQLIVETETDFDLNAIFFMSEHMTLKEFNVVRPRFTPIKMGNASSCS